MIRDGVKVQWSIELQIVACGVFDRFAFSEGTALALVGLQYAVNCSRAVSVGITRESPLGNHRVYLTGYLHFLSLWKIEMETRFTASSKMVRSEKSWM